MHMVYSAYIPRMEKMYILDKEGKWKDLFSTRMQRSLRDLRMMELEFDLGLSSAWLELSLSEHVDSLAYHYGHI